MFVTLLRKTLYLAGLCLLTAAGVFADDLSGRVLDPQGNVVAKAQLRLYERKSGELRKSSSSSDGAYVFQGLPPGDYVIEADASNAALTVRREVNVRGNQRLDLEMKISSVNTEILVTAAGTAQSIEETAKAIDVLDSEQIALRNELTIPEVLRTLPGIRVQTLEGPGSLTTINIRGLRAQDTAILIDGMRFRDATSPQGDATAFLGDMVVGDTERIEILRGAGSSLYGSHALAGVVNISSRPGGGATHGEVRVEGGGMGFLRTVFGIGGGLGTRFAYSGNGTNIHFTKGSRDRTPYRNTSTQSSARFALTPRISVGGRLWYSKSDLATSLSPTFTTELVSGTPAPGFLKAVALPLDQQELFESGQPFNAGNATFIPNQFDADNRRLSSFVSGGFDVQHQISANASYRIAYQGVDTRRTYQDGPAGPGFQPNFNGTYYGRTDQVQAKFDARVGTYNLISAGYEFDRESFLQFDDRQTRANSIGIEQRSNAVFVQDQIQLLDGQLQFTVAGRIQGFNLESPTFDGATTPYENVTAVEPPTAYTGDASVVYFFRSTGTKLRSHVGNSFRAPSSDERFGGSTGTFASYWGDPRLSPERAIAVDGGIDQWLFGSRLQLAATAFYTNLQQTLIFANSLPAGDPFDRFFGYVNGGGGIARGVELSGQASPSSSTKFQMSYTYTNSESRTPTNAAAQYYDIFGSSRHMFAMTATQWIGRRTSVSFDMSAYSDYTQPLFNSADFSSRVYVFNGPTKADVVVHYDFPLRSDNTLELYAKVENIFGQQSYQDGFIGPKAWFTAGMRLTY